MNQRNKFLLLCCLALKLHLKEGAKLKQWE
jgi:hypothetical protein